METQEEIDRARRAHRDAMQQLREAREADAAETEAAQAHQETIDLLARTQRELGGHVVENAALKKRIEVLEGQLDDARTWWTFDDDEVSRGWCVSPGEEEPSGFIAVFSDKAEADRYATWRQEQERAVDDDERDQAWEFPNVLEAEFRVRFWNSFEPAPLDGTAVPLATKADVDALQARICAMDREFGPIQDEDDEQG